MQDAEEYEITWRNAFFRSLRQIQCAVIASDENPDGYWRFLAIKRVSDVSLTNFLTCKVEQTVATLRFE